MGVLILSALKNGYDTFIHASLAFHGAPSSSSYCTTYSSTPYIESWFALPAPLTAALKRVVVAIE